MGFDGGSKLRGIRHERANEAIPKNGDDVSELGVVCWAQVGRK
jgi:hypothetical protein